MEYHPPSEGQCTGTSRQSDGLLGDQYATEVLMPGRSPETVRRELGCIKTLGRWLEAQEMVPLDPFGKVKKPTADKTERRILSPQDAQRVLQQFDLRSHDEARDYRLMKLTPDSGLRISEVIDAKVTDLDWDRSSLMDWGKGRQQRRVPLSPEVKLLLWKWVRGDRKRWAKSDHLFASRLGTPLDRHRVSGSFRAKVVAAGIQYRVRFHDLRHAAATWMLKSGMPKERVSRVLGHANDSITSIYEHLDFEDVQEAHEQFNPLRRLEHGQTR